MLVNTDETRVTGGKDKEKEKELRCSYKTFLSCKPLEFAGTTESIRCIRWLKEMETIFDACDCLENQRIKYVTRLLKDEAIDWWELIRSSLTPENLARLSWAEFKEKLMENIVVNELSIKSRTNSEL